MAETKVFEDVTANKKVMTRANAIKCQLAGPAVPVFLNQENPEFGSQVYRDLVSKVDASQLVPLDFDQWSRVLKSSCPVTGDGHFLCLLFTYCKALLEM